MDISVCNQHMTKWNTCCDAVKAKAAEADGG